MCGIIAYNGKEQAFPVIIEGLKRLEYRGYDSAGIAISNGIFNIVKKKGKVENLSNAIKTEMRGTIGIGHTRWATHGEPNDMNAHPHLSGDGKILLVHNGIIENHETLKKALIELGHKFVSQTDTEVLVHLIEEYKNRENISLEDAIRLALQKVIGAYAIVVHSIDEPEILIGAKKSSPLVIGIGNNELFMASDAMPIVKYTNRVIYLKDEEMAVIKSDGTYSLKDIYNNIVTPQIKEIDLTIELIEKGNYEHFMLKEIFQQKDTVYESMRGRFNPFEGWVKVGGLNNHISRISEAGRIIIVSSGTSWHAGMIGEYLFEDLARIPVEVEYSSEFRYRNPILSAKDVVIAISQSGETADTIAALELAKSKNALTYGIVNAVGSTISRMTDTGSYTHAGPEIGVASTKAFTSQLSVLTLMALNLAMERGTIPQSYVLQLLNELHTIPSKIERVLKDNDKIRYVASEIMNSTNALYLGRGYNFPIAMEGALKLKEISYIHAEGYPAAEMKHGPIALIDENMPVVVISTNQSAYSKIVSNIQEIKARKGKVISIVTEGDTKIKALSDYTIEIPYISEPLTPILSVIPLQLLAYHIAVMRGCDVDQPRNLAKSVTVE
ncbi:MAG: glutamine--fructose-6-phosphate transaminase (isomerizing) [Saprospiraceae bacterium]|nr:glutamine--fructose-6-phosphate transaminase (isomerizing) [Saprospiraceae bacterium]